MEDQVIQASSSSNKTIRSLKFVEDQKVKQQVTIQLTLVKGIEEKILLIEFRNHGQIG